MKNIISAICFVIGIVLFAAEPSPEVEVSITDFLLLKLAGIVSFIVALWTAGAFTKKSINEFKNYFK